MESLEHGGMTVFSWLLEPAETLVRKSHVMVAPLVVSTSFDEPPLRFLNPRDDPVGQQQPHLAP